jgi:acetoin utilization deacetylase AcuC-like enzyme
MRTFFSNEMVASSGSFSPSASKPAEVVRSWQASGLPLEIVPPTPVTEEMLCLAHDPDYVRGVLRCERPNGFGKTSADVARSLPFTTGAMLSAARDAIRTGTVAAAPCSGFHHAGYRSGGAFCTFNGLVVTAQVLVEERLARRVGILDFDQHYGDGTDDIIDRLGLGFITHVTAGATYSAPSQASQFLNGIDLWLEAMASCDVILYQAGADPHIDDPLGGWLTNEQLRERDARVFEGAKRRGIPLAWNLAGGYQSPIRKVLDIHDATAQECVRVYEGR